MPHFIRFPNQIPVETKPLLLSFWEWINVGIWPGLPRDGVELIVLPSGPHKGRWLMLGGWNDTGEWINKYGINTTNEILFSDDGGKSWAVLLPHEGDVNFRWKPSHYAPAVLHVVNQEQFIYLIADEYEQHVWRSPVDSGGLMWERLTDPLTGQRFPCFWDNSKPDDQVSRSLHRAVSFNGWIYVLGGHRSDKVTPPSNDLWKSRDGFSWQQVPLQFSKPEDSSLFIKRAAYGICVHQSTSGEECLYVACGGDYSLTQDKSRRIPECPDAFITEEPDRFASGQHPCMIDKAYVNDVWRMNKSEVWSCVKRHVTPRVLSKKPSNNTEAQSPPLFLQAQFLPRNYASLVSANGLLWLFGGAKNLPSTKWADANGLDGNVIDPDRPEGQFYDRRQLFPDGRHYGGDSNNLFSAFTSADDGKTWKRSLDLPWGPSHADGIFSDGTCIYRSGGNQFDNGAYLLVLRKPFLAKLIDRLRKLMSQISKVR